MNTAAPLLKTDSVRLVPAVMRAAAIVDCLAAADGGMKLSDIARAVSLPKSSVHGLCQTLVHLQLLKLTQDGFYVLGPHAVRWANAFLADADIVDYFHEALDEDDTLTAYTLTLSHLEGTEVIYMSCRNSSAPLGVTFRIGMRVPAVFTATGKAMLQQMGLEKRRHHLPPIWPDPLTPSSVISQQAFDNEMLRIAQNGYSLDDGQLREGMVCIGAAICDRPGSPVAGIALSMMAAEARPEIIEIMGAKIRTLADRISSKMGWVQR